MYKRCGIYQVELARDRGEATDACPWRTSIRTAEQKPVAEARMVIVAAIFWPNVAGRMRRPARPEWAMRAVAVMIAEAGLRMDEDTNELPFRNHCCRNREIYQANDLKKIMTHKKIYGIIF